MRNRELLSRQIRSLRSLMKATPVVRLQVEGINLHAKLEFHNPMGSIKDRPAFWILSSAIERGEITQDTTLIESSSGNFATALALYSRLLNLRFIPVIDPNITPTHEFLLRHTCETVAKVQDRDDAGGYLKARLAKVEELLRSTPHSFWPNQYGNPDAVAAHYHLTGEEICNTFQQLDYVFIGVSTGSTIAGVSARLKEHFPRVRIIAVDAEGSALFGQPPKKRFIPGIGASLPSRFLSQASVDNFVIVPEHETALACNELLQHHGLFAGGSSGSVYAAIKRYLPQIRALNPPNVLMLCADRGTPYIDTLFNPAWVTSTLKPS
jgi:N-(2-amino-2-carboxyethyl)-L-glutamate synthase